MWDPTKHPTSGNYTSRPQHQKPISKPPRKSSNSSSSESKFITGTEWMDVRGPVQFQEFLEADINRDGRVSAAEWEMYLRKKQQEMDAEGPGSLHFELPISPAQANMLLANTGLALTINGMRYKLVLEPDQVTRDVIKARKMELDVVMSELERMKEIKAPLDRLAAVHCRRILFTTLLYLLLQTATIAKLTFFSRFGWDVMEPITYFLTFGTSLIGFMFFQYHKIEYSYPALAALITQKKAHKLYEKYEFDLEYFQKLEVTVSKKRQQLDILIPPMTMIRSTDANYMGLEEEIE